MLCLSFGSTACDERFAFDVPSAGMAPGGRTSQAGSAGAPFSAGGASAGGANGPGECGVHAACPSNLHCVDGHCYPCAAESDCTELGLGRCDPDRHRCVACLTAADCANGFGCDTLASRCLHACKTRSDCPADAHGCDEQRGVCYECDEDRECAKSALGPVCAIDGSGCVHCRSDADCPDQHCDQLVGRCVECRDWHDCDSGLCDPATSVCTKKD